jgi:chorismate dehydratase
MEKYKISVVSYTNSIPFVYGCKYGPAKDQIELQLDNPAQCADRLIRNEAHVGLVPVAEIPNITGANIISDYCIGARSKVRTVSLYSDIPVKEVRHIILDYQSRTSNQLTKMLSFYHWNISPEFTQGEPGYEKKTYSQRTAKLVIGDRCFQIEDQYKYKYDLAEEWHKFTGYPFVFAAWVASVKLTPAFRDRFNKTLEYGMEHIKNAIEENKQNLPLTYDEIADYLNNNINYSFGKAEKESLRLFLMYLYKLNSEKAKKGLINKLI